MNSSSSHMVITAEGFAVRPELQAHANEKAAKVLRHEYPRVHLIRLHLRREAVNSGMVTFAARATAEHPGRDHVVHAGAAEPLAAVNAVFAKLERVLTAAAGQRKHDRHATAA